MDLFNPKCHVSNLHRGTKHKELKNKKIEFHKELNFPKIEF